MRAFTLALAFLIATPVFAAESIRTRVPAAHVEAFQNYCRSSNVPTASCWCMVEKFNETKEGAAVLDAMGLQATKPDESTKKREFLNVLNRHGLKVSQLAPLLAPSSNFVVNVAKQCE